MPDTSTAISPLRPVLRERGGYSVEQARANSFAFELKATIIFYIIATLMVSFLHGVDPRALCYVTLKYTILTVALVFGIGCWQHSDGILFIYFKRRPYDVGDLIELDPSESRVSLDTRKTWRVDRVTLFFTDFVNLYNEKPATWLNKIFANRRMINWSRRPTKFQIILQVPVDAHDGDLLQNFREKIEQYANDNSSEWFAVDTSEYNETVVENIYKEHCIEIRHRESWHELGLVMRSKANLIGYCDMLVGELENKKPAKRHGSALPTAFGCNDKGGHDDSDNIKIDYMEEEKKENDGAKKMDNTLEEGEQKEGDGEKDKNDNDDGHRMNYRIFVR